MIGDDPCRLSAKRNYPIQSWKMKRHIGAHYCTRIPRSIYRCEHIIDIQIGTPFLYSQAGHIRVVAQRIHAKRGVFDEDERRPPYSPEARGEALSKKVNGRTGVRLGV